MEDKESEATTEFKPGETIHPGATLPPVQAQQVVTNPENEVPVAPAVSEIPTGLQPTDEVPEDNDPEQITWTASEFVDHAKSADWYLGLAVAAILSAVALYFFFHDIVTSAAILVAAAAFGLYGRRRPRQLQYRLDSQGLTIANKFLPYSEFRSFAVMEEGAFASVVLLPMKRFGMLTTIYLDPQDEDRVLDLIGQYLPLEPREHDVVDRLMKRIRF